MTEPGVPDARQAVCELHSWSHSLKAGMELPTCDRSPSQLQGAQQMSTCAPSIATAVSTSDCVVAHSGSSDTAAAAKGGSCSRDSLNSRVLSTSWNTYDCKSACRHSCVLSTACPTQGGKDACKHGRVLSTVRIPAGMAARQAPPPT